MEDGFDKNDSDFCLFFSVYTCTVVCKKTWPKIDFRI